MSTKKSPAATPELIRSTLAPFGFPHPPGKGLGFTPEDDALFERGYPHLRILTDEKVDAKKAESIALKALDALDPVLRLHVPRTVARQFLLGYQAGVTISYADAARKKNCAPSNCR